MTVDYYVKRQVLDEISYGATTLEDIQRGAGLPMDLVEDVLWELLREKKVKQVNEQFYIEG